MEEGYTINRKGKTEKNKKIQAGSMTNSDANFILKIFAKTDA